jgi:hypothetical protein
MTHARKKISIWFLIKSIHLVSIRKKRYPLGYQRSLKTQNLYRLTASAETDPRQHGSTGWRTLV